MVVGRAGFFCSNPQHGKNLLDSMGEAKDGLECLGNEGQGTHGRRSEPHECYEFV